MHDKRSKRSRTLLTRVLAAFAVIFALVLVVAQWTSRGEFWDFGTSSVRAEPIFTHTVTVPRQLSSNPTLVLERGTFRSASPVFNVVAWATGIKAGGRQNDLVLEDALFKLDASGAGNAPGTNPAAAAAPGDSISALVGALKELGFETFGSLVIRRSRIILSTGAKTTKIKKIQATFKAGRNGGVAAKGSFKYRGHIVGFNFTRKSTSAPIVFDLESPLLSLRFKGTASASHGLELTGEMEMDADDLRKAGHWLTGDFPAGSGLKQFSVRGTCNYSRGTLYFKNATFSLDKNAAKGGLSLNLGKSPPTIDGTLAATKVLDLTDYLAAPAGAAARAAIDAVFAQKTKPESGGGAALANYNLAMPLIRYVDADIRLSATSVRLGGFELADAAGAITVRAGKLRADVAAVKMEGGNASGRISVDMTGAIPQFGLRGKFESNDIAGLAAGLMGAPMLQGRATLVLDLAGAGKTAAAMADALTGKVNFEFPEGGAIGIDPKRLVLAAGKGEITGWAAGRAQTSIDWADARFVIKNGIVKAPIILVTAGGTAIFVSGAFDLSANTLDLDVLLGKTVDGRPPEAWLNGTPAQKRSVTTDALRLQGPWLEPKIRRRRWPNRSRLAPSPMPFDNG